MRKPKIVVAIPHSHSWFWSQTCLACLHRHPPRAAGFDVRVVVINNSPWSPAIRGITDTDLMYLPNLTVVDNHKTNKFHASALDCVVERFEFDFLMALETDVMVLKDGWLEWFVKMLRVDDYAVGMWHHEKFVNPSCTLYDGQCLRAMDSWCKGRGYLLKSHDARAMTSVPRERLRWGPNFALESPLDSNLNPNLGLDRQQEEMIAWIAGPFAEKRGFAEGTSLVEEPSGQLKGAGWYEPGQQLHHWATQAGYQYTVCPTLTTFDSQNVPLQTVYGAWGVPERAGIVPSRGRLAPGPDGCNHQRQLEAVELFGNGYAAHLWGGTRALDILKHDVTCEFVKNRTPGWLAREARFWRQVVPQKVQDQTLDLIRKYGWHVTGQGNDISGGSERDRKAVEYVRECYRAGGVEW